MDIHTPHPPLGGVSMDVLWERSLSLTDPTPRLKIPKYYFQLQNTFLISNSCSEHVSSVEKCRRCVFEHHNTVWSKETTYFGKKILRSFCIRPCVKRWESYTKKIKTIEKKLVIFPCNFSKENRTFHSQNTFLISKSYSEHVSSVKECRRCVFEH